MRLFTDVFGQKDNVTILQECARGALIFAYALVLIRIAGGRLSGKWSGIDVIVSVILGSTLSRAVTGTAPLVGTMAAGAVIMALHWIVTHVAALAPSLSHLIEGKPITIAADGTLLRGRSRSSAVSKADLEENMRQVGVERLEETARVVLEPSGRLTVLKK
jgi:uncharacterized membrane protein YcaP (DUF421 family)